MTANAKRIVEKAFLMKEHYFPNEHYGIAPYCASFVRWLYKTALGVEFPIVSERPYYKKHGIHYSTGKWFADSLAGDEVGAEIQADHMQEGDILFFKDTCRGYAPGTITHVGVCVGPGGLMADAGSNNNIHIRRYQQTFPNLLVEVRRPRALLAPVASGVELSLKNGQIKAANRGTRVSNLELEIDISGGLNVSVNKTRIPYKIVSLDITATEAVRMSMPTGRFGAPLGQSGFTGKPQSSGQSAHIKLFSHDHKSTATIGGSMTGSLKLKISYQNHALHIWINGKETRAISANITII